MDKKECLTADIFNIQHFSLNDGAGIRTVIFFKGCPLDCKWCHNPESKKKERELSFLKNKCVLCGKCEKICKNSVHKIKQGVHYIDRNSCMKCGKCVKDCLNSALCILGRKYTIDEIMKELSTDDIFFGEEGGVTFSGGEPFFQMDALYELLKECKKKGYSTCIETSGFTRKENIQKAAEYTDCFLYDYKISNEAEHEKFIGADNKIILQNLEILEKVKASVILRCPIIPGVNDKKEHFECIAKTANKYLCIKSIEIMPYHPLGISKASQIGEKSIFDNKDFLNKKSIEEYISELKELTNVSVKVN